MSDVRTVVAGRWPVDGDSELMIACKVAATFRHRLEQVDPEACRQIDDLMCQLGQDWVLQQAQR